LKNYGIAGLKATAAEKFIFLPVSDDENDYSNTGTSKRQEMELRTDLTQESRETKVKDKLHKGQSSQPYSSRSHETHRRAESTQLLHLSLLVHTITILLPGTYTDHSALEEWREW